MSETPFSPQETAAVIDALNQILEHELAGVVRYLHYSFMVFGHSRIPIASWLRSQADESRDHAVLAGEHITSLGGHPALGIGALEETNRHGINDILTESLAHEAAALAQYRKLLAMVRDRSVMLEEYARSQIAAEELHLAGVRKMLRAPGSA